MSKINLLDVLPTSSQKSIKNKTDVKKAISEEKQLLDEFVPFINSCNKILGYKSSEAISIGIDRYNINGKLRTIRREVFDKYKTVPSELINGKSFDEYGNINTTSDIISKVSTTRTIKGSDIKTIVDKFGFVFIPFEALDERSYAKESYKTRGQISTFNTRLKDDYNIYVISPLSYYSINNDVRKNVKFLPSYLGVHEFNLTSLTMTLPMFRAMVNDIDNLDARVSSLENNQSKIVSAVNAIQDNLLKLQRKVNNDIFNTVVSKLELTKAGKIELKQEELTFDDPILIAVPKNTSIESEEFNNTECLVGVCWGPDFTSDVAIALDLKILKGQKSKILDINEKNWS